MVLVDYIGIFFYMRQYFWPHTVHVCKMSNGTHSWVNCIVVNKYDKETLDNLHSQSMPDLGQMRPFASYVMRPLTWAPEGGESGRPTQVVRHTWSKNFKNN